MKQAESRPSFRLREYLWFALTTAVLLIAGILTALAAWIARLIGSKRK